MSGPHAAFFYGTLMAPSVLHRVTAKPRDTFTARPAILHNHRRHRVLRCDYPAMIPAASSSVRGTFVEGLDDRDLARLDAFEGDEYVARKVEVRLLVPEEKSGAVPGAKTDGEREVVQDGESREAWTYIWVAGKGKLEDGEWDFDEFVKEKMHRWAWSEGADEGFADAEEAGRQWEAGGGDPTGGRSVIAGSFEKTLDAGVDTRADVLESAV
ncbi:hypothetical protein MRB53_041828 [Persea americana]|nr:hypothetical protein MRB53_041828 [Persea americana]